MREEEKLWGEQLETLTPLVKKITSPLMAAKNIEPLWLKLLTRISLELN